MEYAIKEVGLRFIVSYAALCLIGLGVPISFAVCLTVANKHSKISAKALRLCWAILAVFGAVLGIFAFWTVRAPYEEMQIAMIHWEICLILLLLIGTAASLLAYIPMPRMLRRHTLPLAFCLVTIFPFLFSFAFFAYVLEHPASAGDGTVTRQNVQDRGIGE